MTISNTSRTAGPFICNGVTKDFPFSYKVFTRDDVLVALTNTATSVETILAIDADFTVTLHGNQDAAPGGVIHMNVAPPAGNTLAATSNVPILQPLDLTNNGGFYPKVITTALDRLAINIQQIAAKVSGGISIGTSAAIAAITGFIANIGAPAGAGQVGFDFGQNYADKTIGWAQSVNKRGINVLRYIPPSMWPAILNGTSTADHTVYLQTAYNAASKSMEREVYHPAGRYNYTRLYTYYDAGLNPGYNIDRDGEISLVGDGTSSENGGTCGTILMCTSINGDGLTVSPAAEDALPYRSRDFFACGISFQGANPGALVLARGVPGARFLGCEFIQNHLDGHGLWITTAYFGVIEKCRFQNRASGTKTGDAIRFGTTIPAGLFTVRDCNVSGYANGLNMYAGDWQQLSVVDSELAGSVYGIYTNGNIQVLNLSRSYFEGECTAFIADSGANRIKNLIMTGCWSYGAGLSGPAINLSAPNSVQIIGGYSQDQNTTYLNIAEVPSGSTGGYMVQGMNFPRTGPAPKPVTLFTGALPEFHGVDYASGDTNVKLFAANAHPIQSRTNFLGNSSYQAAGHQLRTSMKDYGAVNGGSINLADSGYPAVVFAYCITATTTIYLPSKNTGIPHGFNHMVTNAAASNQPLTIKSAVADGEALIGTVAPGAQRTFFFFKDDTATGWK